MTDHHSTPMSNRERRRAIHHGINYNVLKCKAIETKPGTQQNPHYQVHVVTGDVHHRIAINVESEDGSEVLYYVDDHFQHPITSVLPTLPEGFTGLKAKSPEALDFVRGHLFDHTKMVPLPISANDGTTNDLNDQLDPYIKKTLEQTDATIYAFGDRWGPEENVPDTIFNFTPGSGIHDIHMNQGNYEQQFLQDNGIYQDGGLIIHYPSEQRWVAIFLAFQTQSFSTDDNGNPKDLHSKTDTK